MQVEDLERCRHRAGLTKVGKRTRKPTVGSLKLNKRQIQHAYEAGEGV